jgi:hypothetical protein
MYSCTADTPVRSWPEAVTIWLSSMYGASALIAPIRKPDADTSSGSSTTRCWAYVWLLLEAATVSCLNQLVRAELTDDERDPLVYSGKRNSLAVVEPSCDLTP